jgi:hypothetical protein
MYGSTGLCHLNHDFCLFLIVDENVPMADASSWRVELRYRLCFMFSFLLNIDHGGDGRYFVIIVDGGPRVYKIFREGRVPHSYQEQRSTKKSTVKFFQYEVT